MLVFQLSNVGDAVNIEGFKNSEIYFREPEKLYSQLATEVNQDSGVLPSKGSFLLFGYSADAAPISSERGGGSDEIDENTFCGQIYQKLKNEKASNEYLAGFKFKTVKLDSSQRFEGLINHKSVTEIAKQSGIDLNGKNPSEKKQLKQKFFEQHLGIECGPNSITEGRDISLREINGKFSNKFYTTGLKILIHRNDRHLLYQPKFFAENSTSSNNVPRIIGVVGGELKDDESANGCPKDNQQSSVGIGTTTGKAVQAIYGAQVKVLVLRSQAKDCLINKSIIAYSSDEILLRGMLKEYAEDLKDYVIEPSTAPLTYEAYGIVVYGKNDLRDALIQRVQTWSNELKDDNFIKKKESELPQYSSQEKASLISRAWQPIELFYRANLPLFLLKSNQLILVALSLLTILLLLLFLTHRWIATPIAKLFPCLFGLPIRSIERLRARGFANNNKALQLLAEILRGPEQILRETYNRSQGINKSKIDSYDVVQVLEVQVKFAKQFRPDSKVEEEEVVNKIAEQIKTDPHARQVVAELTRSLSTSWANHFGEQVGKESAEKFMSLLSKIAEQVYKSD
jgi:hypothetical protein